MRHRAWAAEAVNGALPGDVGSWGGREAGDHTLPGAMGQSDIQGGVTQQLPATHIHAEGGQRRVDIGGVECCDLGESGRHSMTHTNRWQPCSPEQGGGGNVCLVGKHVVNRVDIPNNKGRVIDQGIMM